VFVVEHQMQFEAEEPASAGLAAPGQAGKHLVAVDPTRDTPAVVCCRCSRCPSFVPSA
jgi:hypothetical protein